MKALSAQPSRVRTPVLIGALLAFALVLTSGCAAGGASQSSVGYVDSEQGVVDSGGRLNISTPESGDKGAARVDLVRYGNVSLEVSDADASLKSITKLIARVGGYLSASSRSGTGAETYVSATFRVPADSFDTVMSGLREEGEVLYEDVSSYEVTMQLVDLEARLKNLRASEAAFLELLGRASSVSDVLLVQTELSRVQGDIESYEAQRSALADQVAMTSISVTLTLPVSPVDDASADFDLGDEIRSALANLITVGRTVVVAAINIVVIGLPIVIVGGLFGALIGRALAPIASRFRRIVQGSRKGARRVARR